MLYAAANCYGCSLELEADDKNKNNLNRRIGNVYNEITSEYTDEILSELNIFLRLLILWIIPSYIQSSSSISTTCFS